MNIVYGMYGGERGIRTPGTTFGGTHDFQSRSLSQLGHLSSLISQLDVKYESIAYSPLWAGLGMSLWLEVLSTKSNCSRMI